ncbi:MAG: hypothetical protein IT290_02895 [Deltaproteobacteria bacterium]|nr:hypothetical protein [Deltaproteobacteria bacterium]
MREYEESFRHCENSSMLFGQELLPLDSQGRHLSRRYLICAEEIRIEWCSEARAAIRTAQVL